MRTVEGLKDLNGAVESIPLSSDICNLLLFEHEISRVGITMTAGTFYTNPRSDEARSKP